MFNFELLFFHGFSSENREILDKAYLFLKNSKNREILDKAYLGKGSKPPVTEKVR